MSKSMYEVRIRTKNHSSNPLKKSMIAPMRTVVRLGSTTLTAAIFPKSVAKGLPVLEVNTVQSIQNSRSKLLMKERFAEKNVEQATWWVIDYNKSIMRVDLPENDNHREEDSVVDLNVLPYPILAKRVFGFKGKGMVKIDNPEELENFISSQSVTSLSGYYFEKFHNYAAEYRLHCTQDECFMSWRKLRKSDSENRWFFNSSNCNWVNPEHELFDRPNNWDEVVTACCNAIKAVGLDIGCVDLRIQSKTNNKGTLRDKQEFIVVEVNSAPALGEQGVTIYRKQINKLIKKLIND